MRENENIEFKELYTDNIYKEIVAFLNTNGGFIYIGYNDDGKLVGLENSKVIGEEISNSIANKIVPDCSIFVHIEELALEDKDYILISVSKGIDIYSLKEKGVTKGTYIRSGSCSRPASYETIKQMIINNSNLSFESLTSNIQNLTFNYALDIFNEVGLDILNNNIMKNLFMINNDNKYTNLALLLSDQNPYSLKVAVYETEEKTRFLDRREFTGSLLEIYDKTLDYLKLNSATYGLIDKSIRTDIEEYPEFILREILLNSLIHRDFSTITSNIINIYKDSVTEFISYGSLYGNITLEDALAGLSTSRNPHLQSIFMRLKRVEAIGSGLRRVNAYYENKHLNLVIKALPSSFIVRLPKISLNNIINRNNNAEEITDYIKKNNYITRKEAEKIVGKGKVGTVNVLNTLVSNNIIMKIGNGPSTKYIIK